MARSQIMSWLAGTAVADRMAAALGFVALGGVAVLLGSYPCCSRPASEHANEAAKRSAWP